MARAFLRYQMGYRRHFYRTVRQFGQIGSLVGKSRMAIRQRGNQPKGTFLIAFFYQ